MRDIAYYRSLPYRRKVDLRTDPDGTVYFLASIEEIPPLRIHGSSREEALLRLDEVFDDVIESMLENDEDVPEPEPWPGHEVAGRPLELRPDTEVPIWRAVLPPSSRVQTVGAGHADHVELGQGAVTPAWIGDLESSTTAALAAA